MGCRFGDRSFYLDLRLAESRVGVEGGTKIVRRRGGSDVAEGWTRRTRVGTPGKSSVWGRTRKSFVPCTVKGQVSESTEGLGVGTGGSEIH